jgi:hypothetical protein
MAKTAETVEVNGKPLRCIICSNDHFWARSAQLNRATSTFFGFDWADRSAMCFVCSECTYIHWFLGK